MRFTIISHAGLYVQHRDVSLLVDPWLLGSCYWRSWWNAPEPDRALIDSLRPTSIYLTHLHWDHFHGPSLRLFDRETQLLVPKLPTTRRMVDDLEYLGFKNIVEIPHGGHVDLGDGVELHSFQSGPGSDSSIVVTDGETTLFNANDSKAFGRVLKQVQNRFPDIDFCFRSHSSARPIPYCVQGFEANFSDFRRPEHYAQEFAKFTTFVNARHAVPFASNACYLHRETFEFNRLISSPTDAAERANALSRQLGCRTEATVMSPGSRWSREGGFEIVDFDYSKMDAYIEALAERHRDKLEACYREEAAIEPDEAGFVAYFEDMMASVPRMVSRRLMPQVAFDVGSDEHPEYWMLDFEAGRIRIGETFARPPPVVIKTPARVLNDCTSIRMFSTWSASKRLSIRLEDPKLLGWCTALFLFLDLYELGTTPLLRNFAPRSLGARLRRWREPIDMGTFALERMRSSGAAYDLYPEADIRKRLA